MVGGAAKAQKLTFQIRINTIYPSPGAGNNPRSRQQGPWLCQAIQPAPHSTAGLLLTTALPAGGRRATACRALCGLTFTRATSTPSAAAGGALGPAHQTGPLRERILLSPAAKPNPVVFKS